MTAWGPVLLMALGAHYQASVGVSNTGRGGLIPVDPVVGNSVAAIDLQVTPRGQISVNTGRLTLGAQYSPRVLQRFRVDSSTVAASNTGRPLLLHNMGVSAGYKFSRAWSGQMGATLSIGELDYNSQAFATTNNQVTDPNVTFRQPIIETLPLSGSAGLSGTLAGGHNVGLTAGVRYVDTDNPGFQLAPDAPDPTPTLLSTTGALTYTKNLGRRLKLGFRADGTYTRLGDNQGFTNMGASAVLNYQATEKVAMSLNVGGILSIFGAGQNLLTGEAQAGGVRAVPAAALSINGPLLRRRDVNINLVLGSGITAFSNPIRGTVEPRVSSTLTLGMGFLSSWSVAALASFVTSAALQAPPDSMGNTINIDETMIALRVPLAYRVSRYFSISGGVDFSLRGPHLRTENFAFRQTTFTGFLTMDANWSTQW